MFDIFAHALALALHGIALAVYRLVGIGREGGRKRGREGGRRRRQGGEMEGGREGGRGREAGAARGGRGERGGMSVKGGWLGVVEGGRRGRGGSKAPSRPDRIVDFQSPDSHLQHLG